jgi:hypothetical protein
MVVYPIQKNERQMAETVVGIIRDSPFSLVETPVDGLFGRIYPR